MAISKWLENMNEQNRQYERDVIFRNVGNNPHTPIDPKTGKILVGNEVVKSQNGKKSKMTPEEKIASVHIKAGQDTILPELNEKDLLSIGATKNKPVLVKASIFDRNAGKHSEVAFEDIDTIVGQALYSPDTKIVPGKNKSGTYYAFYKPIRASKTHKNENEFGTVILDVKEGTDYFEVVHWQWVRTKNMRSVDPNFEK